MKHIDTLVEDIYDLFTRDGGPPIPKEQVDKEMYNVGGSIIRIKEIDGKWKVIEDDPMNRRITGKPPIKLNWDFIDL